MSQHDFDIANQGFAAFRADLNNALKALGSLSSGTAEPATTYANQLWYETDTNTLHIRDEANSAWLDLMVIDQATGSPSFTAGNVGIGTSSPASMLDVEGTINGFVIGPQGLADSAAAPGLYVYNDSDTGFFRPASNVIGFTTGGTERMRITSAGDVGIGTASPDFQLHVDNTAGNATIGIIAEDASNSILYMGDQTSNTVAYIQYNHASNFMNFRTNGTDAARIDSDGNLFIGATSLSTTSSTNTGNELVASGGGYFYRSGSTVVIACRQTNDGTVISIRQAGVEEGNISVSGTTVSFNGGHLSRWAQLPDNSRPELLKGTVMSNLDQMSNWDGEDNEQLNCVQVSAVDGDPDVAGVFVAWDSADDGYNDILLAMTGDMVIRIGAGVTVARGDLLMSAGDGTAKPQGDDIVRSKTIAKVTSTHVSHTYADGSYAVPCVLMAC